LDCNTGSTQAFLVLIASVAFAIFAASRTVETLKVFHGSTEDWRVLRSISILAGLTAVVSVLPLAVSELPHAVEICSLVFLAGSLCYYVHIVYEIVRGHIKLRFRKLSWAMIAVSALAMLGLLLNAVWLLSPSIYKIIVLWLTTVLCIRFYLSIGVVISHDGESREKTNVK
jgi:hypothetical protein